MRQTTDATWVLRPALAARSWRYLTAAGTAAVVFGVYLPIAPRTAIVALVVIPLAFAAPVSALAVLIGVSVFVPFEMQDRFAVVGGRDQPGILLIDVLMLLGLTRIGWLIVGRRLKVDLPLLLGMVLAAICTAGVIWGFANGADVSWAGTEGRRVLLGTVTFVLAWPLVGNRAARPRLIGALICIGLLLGLWGLAQWMFSVSFTTGGDVGVREGEVVSRQLQGGMFAYPVAVVLAWAALIVGQLRNVAVKCLLVLILFTNAACLLLTFERTLWVATAVGCLFLIVSSGAHALGHAVKWAGVGVALMVGAAAIASAEASTAVERLTSVTRLENDNSLKWRVVESQIVAEEINAQPITGSGFGAEMTWGVKDTFATMTTSYIHNGYLWLAWKVGIPAAAVTVLFLVRALLRRFPRRTTVEWATLQRGSQASLLALLLICITFPLFNALSITAVIGLLVAICYSSADTAAIPSQPGYQGINGSRDDE